MCSLINFLNILMNQKARHIGKRKAGSSTRKCLRKLHISEYANSCFTKKKRDCSLFQRRYNLFKKVTISSAIPYISGANSTSSSLKKGGKKEKKKSQEREREREEERVRTRKKKKRKMRRKRRKGKKRRRKRKKMERVVLKVFFF